MQTVTGIKHFQSPQFETLRDLLQRCVTLYADRPAFRFHRQPRGPEVVKTYREFVADINALGTALLDLGLKKKHLGIVGRNCYEWALAHNAIVNGVGVSVPLDRQLPQPELLRLCQRGKVSALFYHAKLQEVIEALAEEAPDIRYFICMQEGQLDQSIQEKDPRFLDIAQLIASGHQQLKNGDDAFTDAAIDPEAMSLLLFTSGTGEQAKAVMHGHRSITHNISAVLGTLDVKIGQRALSILPLNHTFENTVGMYMVQAYGCCICVGDGMRYFAQNLKEWSIEILIGVPIVFETTYRQIEKRLRRSGHWHKVQTMRAVTRTLQKVGIDLRRRVFRRILAELGGKLRFCVCGAAPIDRDIVRFYNEIGIDFYCGYGLTETAPVISVCNSFNNTFGSVGPPVSGIEVAIDTPSDKRGAVGEILTRSDSVMLGYFENPDATAAVMTDDGWFRTGDLGYLDKKGSIFITGRLKSMIVLTNGKKAFPEELEALLSQIEGVHAAFVWGETSARGNVDICAKLVVDPAKLPAPLSKQPDDMARHLKEKVRELNASLPPYKEVRHVFFSRQELQTTDGTTLRRLAEQERTQKALQSLGKNAKDQSGHWLDG